MQTGGSPPAHLGRPSVLPAGSDVSDDAGVALLAHVDAVHLDDALAWVQPRHGRHGAWGETETSKERLEDTTAEVTVGGRGRFTKISVTSWKQN